MADADRNQAHGGKTVYGACVGILMLQTRFPRTPSRLEVPAARV
jgi:glutamine amidotransferase PdxT